MNEEEFGLWRQHDVTKVLFAKMREQIEDRKDDLVWGRCENPDLVRGYILAYMNIVNMEFNDLAE